MTNNPDNNLGLAGLWQAFRSANPKVRIRDAATQLGVSELELVATGSGISCTPLRPEWPALMASFLELGEVMALTRSTSMVHESTSIFSNLKLKGNVAIFLRPGLDTRYLLKQWHHAYAVNENQRLSLQFFDRYGEAVHKIYLTERSNHHAYQTLIDNFRYASQPFLQIARNPTPKSPANVTADAIDATILRRSWASMVNVHEANQLIRQLGGQRQLIYPSLGEDYAKQLPTDTVENLLTTLAEEQHPFLLFGMNHGAVQSFSGVIKRLLRTGPWFNVLDTDFNLHLRTADIGEVWRILKPSADGLISSLSVLDTTGHEIMVMADQRGSKSRQSTAWADYLSRY